MGKRSIHSNPDSTVFRRRYLGLTGVAAAGLLAGCSEEISDDEDGDGGPTAEASVSVDPETRNKRAVPDTLFGRFAEHYGAHEIYPGIYAEHVTNTSFVDWPEIQGNVSHVYGVDRIGEYDEVPFPWEPIGGDETCEQPNEGGVRGYGTWDSDGGWPEVDQAHRNAHQRVVLEGGSGGVRQQLVLPDWRTLEYECALSIRSDGIDEVIVRLTTPDGEELASERVAGLTEEWERYEGIELELAERSDSQLEGGSQDNLTSPYGEYALEIVADGTGHVDLDWISLLPDDAVEGKFNPTTIDIMDDRNVSLLKWPGGNVTSTYKWEDGIGPIAERPIRPNVVWDGLDTNQMGTAEYVEFCDLTDVEATITVGVTVEEDDQREFQPPAPITPEDAANWVEYCNGDTDTEYGALRAEHGYEEPFDVQVWEVGNEVWGPWQAGGTQDPALFAERAAEFAAAMREVDDSITIIPDGMDPKYDDDGLPDPVEWNETVFDIVGEDLDGIGMHRYNWGIREEDPGSVAEWKDEHDADGIDYNEVLIMFPTQFGELLSETASLAEDAGLEDTHIMVGEWGLYPTVDEGDPAPTMATMAGAAYVAGMYNAFIRESDHTRRASHTHLPVRMFPPENVEFPADPNPLLPVGYTLRLYASAFEGDETWNVIETTVDSETRDIPETGVRIRAMEDVPYVDSTSMITPENDAFCAFLTNRNLREETAVTLEIPGSFEETDASVIVQRPTDDPHDPQAGIGEFPESWYDWTGLEGYEIDERDATVEDGSLTVTLEPSAIARVRIDS